MKRGFVVLKPTSIWKPTIIVGNRYEFLRLAVNAIRSKHSFFISIHKKITAPNDFSAN